MQITLEDLLKRPACKEGLVWFQENFGTKADSEEIINKLRDEKCSGGWMTWLFEKYTLSGLCEGWRTNGHIFFRINYKDGAYHGLYEEWDADGHIFFRENYKDGELLEK